MQIRTRMCISLDGCVTTRDGLPVQLADPAFVAGESYGFPEFQESCDAVLMGRTTFEPALGADRWPWPNLDVFVIGSHRAAGTPDHVVLDSDPEQLPGEAPRCQSGPRRPPCRRPSHNRDLSRPRGARQARTDRVALPRRRDDASDAVTEHRHRTDTRERARSPGRGRRDRLRGAQRCRSAMTFRGTRPSPAA